MPRHNGSGGRHHTKRQNGTHSKRGGVGTYSTRKKSRLADRYDRPAIERGFQKG